MQRFTSRPEPEPDPPSNITFQAYLQQHQLNPLDVALAYGSHLCSAEAVPHWFGRGRGSGI